MHSFFMRITKTLARLRGCTGSFVFLRRVCQKVFSRCGSDLECFVSGNGVFNWTNVSTAFRTQEAKLTFVVYDHLNTSDAADITIIYCGCEKQTQCMYKDFSSNQGKFKSTAVRFNLVVM